MLAESRTCRGHSNKGAEFSAELVHRIGNLQLITFSGWGLSHPFLFAPRPPVLLFVAGVNAPRPTRVVRQTHGVFDPQVLNPGAYPRRHIRPQLLIEQACEI